MEKKELSEYNERESQISRKLYSSKTKKLLKNKDEKLGHLDFYPEFAENLSGKTYTNWITSIGKLLFQLPFYDTILLPFKPFSSPKLFEQIYGIDIPQTLELSKKGKIIPFPAYPPLLYKDVDYLDDLLELRNPVYSFRYKSFNDSMLNAILRLDDTKLANWIENYHEKIKALDFTGAMSIDQGTLNTVSPIAREEVNPASTIAENLGYLHLNGYEEISKKLETIPDATQMYILAGLYKDILIQQPSWAMGGSLSIDQSTYQRAMNFQKIDVEAPFPSDIGKLLTKEFNLLYVKDIGFEKTIEITSNTEFARKALFELEKVVTSENINHIQERSHILQEKWEESNQVVESMINVKNKLTWYIPTAIGITGSAASTIDQVGLIGTILGVAASLKFTGPIMDRLYQLIKPNHVVALYNLGKNS